MKIIGMVLIALTTATFLGSSVGLHDGGRLSLRDGSVGHLLDSSDRPVQVAGTCFLIGEQTSGMNKICYYNCLGSTAAITIRAVQLCPLSIRR